MFKKHNKILLFDTETTGLSMYLDRIIEYASVSVLDGVVVKERSVLINWGIEIPSFITELTGITQQDIIDNGISPKEFLQVLTEELSWADLIIAHNLPFDLSKIHHLLIQFGVENGIDKFNIDYFDSLSLVRDHIAKDDTPRKPRRNAKDYESKMIEWEEKKKLMQTHQVSSVCRYFNIELDGAHRALNDVIAIYDILNSFSKKYPNIDIDYYINKFGYKKRWKIDKTNYYPDKIEMYFQGDKGEGYILNAKEQLF